MCHDCLVSVEGVGWIMPICAVCIYDSCLISPCSLSCYHFHSVGLAPSLTDFCQKSVCTCNDR